MFLRPLLIFVIVAATVAEPIQVRQTTNTNAQINHIIDELSISTHASIPSLDLLLASHHLSDFTVAPQFRSLVTAFNTSTRKFNTVTASTGSTTVRPTNDEVNFSYAAVITLVSTGLSGLNPTNVPGFASFIATLDPAIANSIAALGAVMPNSIAISNIMMRDARQFLLQEGLNQTYSALGFA
ncbi:POXA3b laccase small subunit [Mycena floridula]|nr:POXA3b laccase small subunit [Mycena floridula]